MSIVRRGIVKSAGIPLANGGVIPNAVAQFSPFALSTLVVVGDSISDMMYGDGLRPGNNQETIDYFNSRGYDVEIDSHAVSGADFRGSATDRRSIQLQVQDVVTQYSGQSNVAVLLTIGTNEYGGASPENDWVNWDQARKDAYSAVLQQMCIDITNAGLELILSSIPYRRSAGEELRVQLQNEELYYPLIQQYCPRFWNASTSKPVVDLYQFTLDFGASWYSDLIHPDDAVGTPATREWLVDILETRATMPQYVQPEEPPTEEGSTMAGASVVDVSINADAGTSGSGIYVVTPTMTFSGAFTIGFWFEWLGNPVGGPDVLLGRTTGNTDSIVFGTNGDISVKGNNINMITNVSVTGLLAVGQFHYMQIVRDSSNNLSISIDGVDSGASANSASVITLDCIGGNFFGLPYQGVMGYVSFTGEDSGDRMYPMDGDTGATVVETLRGQDGTWHDGTLNSGTMSPLSDAEVDALRITIPS